MTATGRVVRDGDLFLSQGTISQISDSHLNVPAATKEIDLTGKYITPGIIDAHSHIGVYSQPEVIANEDGNEMTSPNTASARAEYGFWPQDPAIAKALASGVTSALILPGSANLIGGRGFTISLAPGVTADDMRFPNAPTTLKMACGENPKRVYAERGGPATRMAEYAYFRSAFAAADEYKQKWDKFRSQPKGTTAKVDAPSRDLSMEILAEVLRGQVLVQVHCYRADELKKMLDIAEEYKFSIRAFHHALEAYKLADILAKRKVGVATWADWWGYKMEMLDGIPEAPGILAKRGVRVAIHSDSAIGIQHLNQEAAKAMASARAMGLAIDENEALRWITSNPAWMLGIDSVAGTIEPGKRADIVVWSGNPFSVYSRVEIVVIAGRVVYERARGERASDFQL